jgi:hypothetical protein
MEGNSQVFEESHSPHLFSGTSNHSQASNDNYFGFTFLLEMKNLASGSSLYFKLAILGFIDLATIPLCP